VNHFQGRVSCPYGQTAGTTDLSATCGVGVVGGAPITPYYPTTDYPSGTTPTTCTIPGGATVLAGQSAAVQEQFQVQVAVPPQVFERNTASAVYCSCRCANPDGQTNDGSVYCTCPDNYTCTQLVSSIGGATEGQLVGGYCMLNGTGYKASQSSDCTVSGTCCNPSTANAVCGMNGNEACTCP